jgi:hypothetical protein
MSRRIIPGLCVLALAVPATAVAQPVQDPPATKSAPVVYGDAKYDLQNQHDLSAVTVTAVTGDTKSDLKPTTPGAQTGVDRVGSLSAEQLAAGYGTTKPAAPAAPSFASHDDNTNGWQIAAWAEAAVLAAFALGSAVLISGRTRSRRLSS